MDVEYNIKPFDIKKMKKESVAILIGKRNTGKSILIRDILYHHRDIPIGSVVSHTDHLTHYYDKFIPSMLINRSFSSDIVTKLFKRQEKALAENWKNPNAFMLLDDCMSDAKVWKKDTTVEELFFNGRHYKLLVLIGMQIPLGIPPALRSNIDYTFILKNNIFNDRKKIYENYAGMFRSKSDFEAVFDACTEDYNCLVIDNTTDSNKLEDQVFCYKADIKASGNFKMCDKKIWELDQIRNNKPKGSSTTKVVDKGKGKITINRKEFNK
jgi:hypothetical protein